MKQYDFFVIFIFCGKKTAAKPVVLQRSSGENLI